MKDLNKKIEGMTFPLIVKPNGLRLSLLVTLCNNKDELQRCLEKTFEVLDDVYLKESGTGTPSLLIEEFIVGELFSVDAYISPSGEITCAPPIRTITAHDKGLEGFYGCEFIVPVNLSDKEIEKAYETSKSAIRALNLRSCTAHVELYKCKNNVWKIVELGPRIGGHRDELYGGAYGIDHYYNDLASRIGLELELPKSLKKYVSCLGVYPDSEGEIVSIDGTSEALDIPSVDSVDLKMQPGDIAVFANNGGRSAVHASLSNNSAQDLLSDIEKIRNTIRIRTK